MTQGNRCDTSFEEMVITARNGAKGLNTSYTNLHQRYNNLKEDFDSLAGDYASLLMKSKPKIHTSKIKILV